MLSLVTCKALAEKYPEVRERRLRSCELFQTEHRNGVSRHYWCPRTGDLLEIARNTGEAFSLVSDPANTANWGHPWTFHFDFDVAGEAEQFFADDTSEAAVAAWLLARK